MAKELNTIVYVRVPNSLLEQIDELGREMKQSRSTAIKILVRDGLKHKEHEHPICHGDIPE